MDLMNDSGIDMWAMMLIGFVQLAWYVAVPVMLYQIWRKVRHLPG